MILKFKFLIIVPLLIFPLLFISPADNSDDIITISDLSDDDLFLNETLEKQSVVFDLGGSLSTTSRILFKTFTILPDNGGFEPVPNDKWYGDFTGQEYNLKKTDIYILDWKDW